MQLKVTENSVKQSVIILFNVTQEDSYIGMVMTPVKRSPILF